MQDFSKVRIGTKLYHIMYGWGSVTALNPHSNYPIELTTADGGSDWFMTNGKFEERDLEPTIYWDKPEVTKPPQPK